MSPASLDRRVVVQTNSETIVRPLSYLRDEPFIVLLGEPGLGKSTALCHEADSEGCSVLTCRQAMNGTPFPNANTVFLDALDEYRTGKDGKDKLLQLANTLSAKKIRRWRLTCRAEDWRDAADVDAMRRAANNSPIVVARLLPLDKGEAQAILSAIGAPDPRKFVAEAQSRGASPFLESPLSLRLLHSAVVSNGVWPTSRFELFDKATWALAHEYDPERVTDPRPSPEIIIKAASQMCFYALATGARALWYSNAMRPNTSSNEYLSINSLDLEPSLAAAALDTALFRGEGHAFEAFHRTVAEFLAARFLARKVAGAEETAPAFPLRRAIALITSTDQKAPSELRGLYAWFAAQLHREGDPAGALQLIERDAATVLAYGDAAAFNTTGRKSILVNLDREDPYFLHSQHEATVLGGLAGEDLVDDFITILDSDVRSHRQVTVLQALADGPPVSGIQDKLHEIALNTNRPPWMRERVSEIFVKSTADQTSARRKLIDELDALPISTSQMVLRARILSGMPVDSMDAQGIRQLLSDFGALPTQSDDFEIEDRGALAALAIAIRRSPLTNLFDAPIKWGRESTLHNKFQIRSFIDQTLASIIDARADVDANKLLTWINNSREHMWDMLDSDVVKAIQRWVDYDTNRRELEVFLAILTSSAPEDGPWVAVNQYISTVRRIPSESMIAGLIELAKGENRSSRRKRLFQVAAYAARGETNWTTWRDKITTILKAEGRLTGFIKSLLSDPNARWKKQEARRKVQQDAETEAARRNNIHALTPKLAAIASGVSSEFGVLRWAADHYRNAIISKEQSPLARVVAYTNEEIAAAIAEGFVQFAMHTDINIDVENLGQAEAKNGSYPQEYVVAAGVHQALLHSREGDLATCPSIVALISLRQSYFSGENAPSITDWALRQLAKNPEASSTLILRYWNAALDAGDDDLATVHRLMTVGERTLISECLRRLLSCRPNLPIPALRDALVAGAAVLSMEDLAHYADVAIKRGGLDKEQRDIWNFVALALNPTGSTAGLPEAECQAALSAPNGELAKAFNELSPRIDVLDRIRIEVLGKTYPADDDDWRQSGTISGVIRAAIRRLSASKNANAGDTLKALVTRAHPSWGLELAHAAAEHARMKRDDLYAPPSIDQLMRALPGGPPASPADLAAVVIEEIERYKRTIRSGSEMPWKRFWNTDKDGAATTPQIENEDRDRLLEILRVRLNNYGIASTIPEARRAENTRVDILLLSHRGKNLPIEAKRHYNKELWTAPVGQLKGYSSDEDACGYGIYLVFWFGLEFKAPVRSDGDNPPSSAEHLETLLINDLPLADRDKLTIVVLDVSRPPGMIAAVERRKQSSQKRTIER